MICCCIFPAYETFDETLQNLFQSKTQQCAKLELFIIKDQETKQLFSSRSDEKHFSFCSKKDKQILQQLKKRQSSHDSFCTKPVLIRVNN